MLRLVKDSVAWVARMLLLLSMLLKAILTMIQSALQALMLLASMVRATM